MATIYAYGSKGHHAVYLIVNEQYNSSNIENNTSKVSYELHLYSTTPGYRWSSFSTMKYTINIDGQVFTGKLPSNYDGKSDVWVTGGSDVEIKHNDDGNKTIGFSISIVDESKGSYAYTTFGNASASDTLTLAYIPRATELSSVAADNLDGNITFNVSVKNNSFSHRLFWFVNNEQIGEFVPVIVNNQFKKSFTAEDIYYELEDDLITIKPLWPTDKSKISVKFKLVTYNGGTQIGDPSEKTIEVSLGDMYKPSSPNITISQTELIENKFHAYIQNQSIVKVTVDGTNTTKLNSTISKYGFSYNSVENAEDKLEDYNEQNEFMFQPKNTGKYNITGLIEDSRGLKTIISSDNYESIEVMPYNNPVINTFTVERDDENAKKVHIKLDCSVYSLDGKNDKSAFIKYTNLETSLVKREEISEHFTIGPNEEKEILDNNGNNITNENGDLLTGDIASPYYVINKTFELKDTNIDDDSPYYFEVEIYDFFTDVKPITSGYSIGTAFQLMNFNVAGDGLAFGKVADNNLDHTIEIADNMTMLYHGKEVGSGGDTLPYGSIVEYDGDSVPSGYEEVTGSIYKGFILYDNQNGTTGTITLNDNVSNYDHLEIFYKDNVSGQFSTKFIPKYSTRCCLTVVAIDNGSTQYIKNRQVLISGTSITNLHDLAEASMSASAQNVYSFPNAIYILRIVGFKKI